MDNLISMLFPTAPAGSSSSAKGSSRAAQASGGFSPAFFELLQGEISALTAPGKGEITTEDINKLSDTQIEMLGNFLSNVEVDENGNLTLVQADTDAAATGVDVLPQAMANGPENDPAVLDVLQQMESSSAAKTKDGNDDTLLLSFEQLSQHLEQLLNGLPQESRLSLIQINPNSDQSLTADANGKASAEIIATGMSPADMLAYIQSLSNGTTESAGDAENDGDSDDAATDRIDQQQQTNAEQYMMFALVSPSQTQSDASNQEQNVIFLPRGVIISAAARSENGLAVGKGEGHDGDSEQAATNGRGGEHVARALNKALQSLSTTQGSVNNLYNGTAGTSADATSATDDFSKVLNMFQQSGDQNADSDGDGSIRLPLDKGQQTPLTHAEARAVQNAMQNAQHTSAGLSSVQTNAAPNGQNMTASPDWASVFPDGINWAMTPNGQQASANGSVNMATMTSLISQNNAATATHPASQMVAATMTKAGETESKTLTLRLDPPDLGRVQVEMQMSKDNVVKAIITSEKPHTHMMLQRDAHALERALQDSGIDATSGNAIQFELSQDGSMFSDNNGKGGDNFAGGGSGGSQTADLGGDGEIIESHMTWDVDPETGYMHYNLVV